LLPWSFQAIKPEQLNVLPLLTAPCCFVIVRLGTEERERDRWIEKEI